MQVQKIQEGWIETESPLTYHGWPTVCHTGNNRLLAVCSGGREKHVCPFGRIYLYESLDGGSTWSIPRILSDGPLDDRDAGITVAADGSLIINWFSSICFLNHHVRDELPERWREAEEKIKFSELRKELGFFMIRSTDGGKTWTKKQSVPVNNVHGPALLRDGSLLWVGRKRGDITGGGFGNSVVAYSSHDHGVSWELEAVLPAIPEIPHKNWHEIHTVQDPENGMIYTQIRVQPDNTPIEDVGIWQTESWEIDKARIWTQPHFICNGHPPHLTALQDKRLLMTYGYRRPELGVRCRVSIKKANHLWWSNELILCDQADNLDVGYPATVQLQDGSFFTLWYQFRKSTGTASLHWLKWNLTE